MIMDVDMLQMVSSLLSILVGSSSSVPRVAGVTSMVQMSLGSLPRHPFCSHLLVMSCMSICPCRQCLAGTAHRVCTFPMEVVRTLLLLWRRWAFCLVRTSSIRCCLSDRKTFLICKRCTPLEFPFCHACLRHMGCT